MAWSRSTSSLAGARGGGAGLTGEMAAASMSSRHPLMKPHKMQDAQQRGSMSSQRQSATSLVVAQEDDAASLASSACAESGGALMSRTCPADLGAHAHDAMPPCDIRRA